MGYLYGCGRESARRYFEEIRDIWHEHVVGRLLYPLPPQDVLAMRRDEVAKAFPHLLAILDATNWQQQKAQNFLLNRLTYSAYKHYNSLQVLAGKDSIYCCSRLLQSLFLWSLLVVSTERIFLWRSQIFGGMSNEIDVLLDESTLSRDMRGILL